MKNIDEKDVYIKLDCFGHYQLSNVGKIICVRLRIHEVRWRLQVVVVQGKEVECGA